MPAAKFDWFTFYALLGRVVTNWSLSDYAIDQCIAALFKGYDPARFAEDVPRDTTQKIVFLRHILQTATALEPFSEQGVRLLDRLEALSRHRALLTQGAAMKVGADAQTLQFSRISIGEHGHERSAVILKVSDLDQLGVAMLDLATEWAVFAHRLTQHLGRA
jgi:hypothetical protein